MLISYIYEVTKFDIEIASVLKSKPTTPLTGKMKDINMMPMGKIEKENWIVMFHRGSGASLQKCLFALPDKHLFSTVFLELILDIICQCKLNDDVAKNIYFDMIRWYTAFLMHLLSVIPKLFKTTKKTQQ